MDNQTNNSASEADAWIDDRMASLVPPGNWHPDSRRALARFKNRQDPQETASPRQSPRWLRISMAAAVLGAIGLVITLLPWQALWSGPKRAQNRISEPVKVETPAKVQEATPTPPAPVSPPPEPKQTAVETYYSDVARRAHIQGTVAAVQQPAPPAPEPEQNQVERVGSGVTAPRAIPPIPEPDYTDVARQAHIQGTVVLDVVIRADGTGKVVKVNRSLGYGLDEKAIETFEKWRFSPGTKDGKPVDVQLQVVINFHLY